MQDPTSTDRRVELAVAGGRCWSPPGRSCGDRPTTPDPTPTRGDCLVLDHQFGALGTQVARQRGWHHVATYADQPAGSSPWERPGLARLLVEAPGRVDLVVVDSYCRLSANHYELAEIIDRLRWSGVAVVLLRPSRAWRLAKLVANLALADLIGGVAR